MENIHVFIQKNKIYHKSDDDFFVRYQILNHDILIMNEI